MASPLQAPTVTSTVRVSAEDEIDIYYELYENQVNNGATGVSAPSTSGGCQQEPARVLLIMGVAATCVAWHTQIQALLARSRSLGRAVQIVAYDNRGVGRSSCPKERRHYSSATMARDAAALMEHLGWGAAHVVGFSMGTQIAAKLAASVAPDRVLSLVLVSAAGGGVSSLPRSLHAIRHSLRVLTARTLIGRARADLRLHFTKGTLHSASSASSASSLAAAAAAALPNAGPEGALEAAPSGGSLPPSVPAAGPKGSLAAAAASGAAAAAGPAAVVRRQKEDLIDEYVAHAQCMPPQATHGLHGHLHTVWNHKLSPSEKATLRAARIPILFIHGLKDKVAPPAYAQRLSRELGASIVLLPGAHVVMRESAQQVNALLFDLVFGDAAFCTRREVAPIPFHAALFHQHSGSGCSSGGSAAATSGLKAANGASVCRDSGGGGEVAVGQADAAAAVAEAAIAEAGLDAWRRWGSQREGSGRRAYVFYASRDIYMCSVIINIDRLARLGADPAADRVVIVPASFVPRPIHRTALEARGVRIVESPPLAGPKNDEGMYNGCMSKLYVFALTDYARVIYMDGDALVKQHLDSLFQLPAADLWAPRAYWMDPGKPKQGCEKEGAHVGARSYAGLQMKFTSALMVITPSERLWHRLKDRYFPDGAPPRLANGMFDMDLLNSEFKDEAALLPGGELLAVSQHWQEADRDPVWSSFQGRVGQEELWAAAKVVHFSQPGKPWFWNTTELRQRYPTAHTRLYEAWDTWWEASKALC